MNERIKELAEKANPSSKEIYKQDNWQYNCVAWCAQDIEKFAKLIVRECINVLDPNGEYTATYSHQPQPGELRKVLTQTEYGQFQAAALLKLHFGVE
jgi:hypothetical protein